MITAAPPGTNPHLFEPSPRQMAKMQHAKLWIGVGEEAFEQHTLKALLAYNPQLNWINLSPKLPHLESQCCEKSHSHSSKDPHIWMSPKLAKLQVQLITEKLLETFPEYKKDFLANSKILQTKLQTLITHITKKLAPYKHTGIIVSHPAIGYFCKDYHLVQISVESEGKAPQIKRLMDILEKAKELHVKCALTMPEFNNQGVTLISEKLQIKPQLFDPLAQDYFHNMNYLTDIIVESNQGSTHE